MRGDGRTDSTVDVLIGDNFHIVFPLRELHRLDEAMIGELVRLKLVP